MNRPTSEIEAAFNKNGLYFWPKESFADPKPFQKIGVYVETGVLPDAKLIDIDFMVTVKSPQGSVTSFTDWEVLDRDGQKILRFIAWKAVPKGTFDTIAEKQQHFSSFTDLLWLKGHEEVDPAGLPTAETKIMPGYPQADLGWHLPCRFVDPLIAALGKMNDFMLSGTLEDAILYGPLTLNAG